MAYMPFCLCFCSFINTFSFHNLCFKLFLFKQKWLNTCWTCSTIQKIPSLHTVCSVLNVTRISVFHFYRIYWKCDFSSLLSFQNVSKVFWAEITKLIYAPHTFLGTYVYLLLLLFYFCGKQRARDQPTGWKIPGSKAAGKGNSSLFQNVQTGSGPPLFSWYQGSFIGGKAAIQSGLLLICTYRRYKEWMKPHSHPYMS